MLLLLWYVNPLWVRPILFNLGAAFPWQQLKMLMPQTRVRPGANQSGEAWIAVPKTPVFSCPPTHWVFHESLARISVLYTKKRPPKRRPRYARFARAPVPLSWMFPPHCSYRIEDTGTLALLSKTEAEPGRLEGGRLIGSLPPRGLLVGELWPEGNLGFWQGLSATRTSGSVIAL